MPALKVYLLKPSLRAGFFSVFDAAGYHHPRIVAVHRRSAFTDLVNIGSDWRNVGRDLNRAIECYATERRRSSETTLQPNLFPGMKPPAREKATKAG